MSNPIPDRSIKEPESSEPVRIHVPPPKATTPKDAKVQEAVQDKFPSGPLAPPTQMTPQLKAEILVRNVIQFMPDTERKNYLLSNSPKTFARELEALSSEAKEQLILDALEKGYSALTIAVARNGWDAFTQDEKIRITWNALRQGDRDMAIFCLRPTGGLTPKDLCGDRNRFGQPAPLLGLLNALRNERMYTGRHRRLFPIVNSNCQDLIFRHPSITDQDRTEIASRIIEDPTIHVDSLKLCLKFLENVHLTFEGKTILQHAENVPKQIDSDDALLEDMAYESQQARVNLLREVVSDPRFAVQPHWRLADGTQGSMINDKGEVIPWHVELYIRSLGL